MNPREDVVDLQTKDPTVLRGVTKMAELGEPVLVIGSIEHHIWVRAGGLEGYSTNGDLVQALAELVRKTLNKRKVGEAT